MLHVYILIKLSNSSSVKRFKKSIGTLIRTIYPNLHLRVVASIALCQNEDVENIIATNRKVVQYGYPFATIKTKNCMWLNSPSFDHQ